MKRTFVLIAVALFVCRILLFAAMSDDKASTEANKIWGVQKFLMKVRPTKLGSSNWTYRIGYQSPGCDGEFTVLGEGFNSWDAAFAVLPADKGIDGPFAGMRTLHANTPAPPESAGTHTQIPGATTATSFQYIIDGQPYGPRLTVTPDTTVPVGWNADLALDTTTLTNGLHLLCGAIYHTDGAMALTHGRMFRVQQ